MITLFEAHFEIVRPLIGLMLLDAFPINEGSARLAHSALIFTHVVQLGTTHGEVWLCVAILLENLPGHLLV